MVRGLKNCSKTYSGSRYFCKPLKPLLVSYNFGRQITYFLKKVGGIGRSLIFIPYGPG